MRGPGVDYSPRLLTMCETACMGRAIEGSRATSKFGLFDCPAYESEIAMNGGYPKTQSDLDALPENGGFEVVETILKGHAVRIPRVRPAKAMYQPGNCPLMMTDARGTTWMLGFIDGVLHKRRLL